MTTPDAVHQRTTQSSHHWSDAWQRLTLWTINSTDFLLAIAAVSLLAWFGIHAIDTRLAASPSAQTFKLWAMAGMAIGGFIGFLFGIPRVLQGDNNSTAAEQNAAANANAKGAQSKSAYLLRVNTNLEQISDWLTKILVGIGLVELGKVPDYVEGASKTLATALAPAANAGTPAVVPPDAEALASALILYFPVIGFLGGYLVTRLFLSGAFSRADQRAQATIRVSDQDLDPEELAQQQQSVIADLQREVSRLSLGAGALQPAPVNAGGGVPPMPPYGPVAPPPPPIVPPAPPAQAPAPSYAAAQPSPRRADDAGEGMEPDTATMPVVPTTNGERADDASAPVSITLEFPVPVAAPVAQPSASPATRRATPFPYSPPSVNAPATRRRILWVDDNPRNNAAQTDLLKQQGYDVTTALSTSEAVKLLNSGQHFDAYITDWVRREDGRMVYDAGLRFLKELQARGLGPAFVFAAASSQEPRVQEAAATAGARLVTSSSIDLLKELAVL